MSKIRIISQSDEPFADRVEAGRLLAKELDDLRNKRAVVLGIPRGGLVVAHVLANNLNGYLDIVLSRKLGAPGNPELAIGAISEEGKIFLNDEVVLMTGTQKEYIQREKKLQLEEMSERAKIYRKVRAKVSLQNKDVIITDDGIATGATMRAAVLTARQENPKRLVVALPVGAEDSVRGLGEYCDEIVVLRAPSVLMYIGDFYLDSKQTTDEEVIEILKEASLKQDTIY